LNIYKKSIKSTLGYTFTTFRVGAELIRRVPT